jgi:hypothetical protein
MLIVKGIAVGALLWFIGIIIYVGFSLFYGQVEIETNHATGLSAVKAATLWNPVFWLGIILAMAAGFALVRFRVIK